MKIPIRSIGNKLGDYAERLKKYGFEWNKNCCSSNILAFVDIDMIDDIFDMAFDLEIVLMINPYFEADGSNGCIDIYDGYME